ncbi:MAG: hypothetical protein K5744_09070 [Eubacterium sp.]|nr:hypothetical protein [Eubacterium sp.]
MSFVEDRNNNWNRTFWRNLENKIFDRNVQHEYSRMSDHRKHALIRHMPSIPPVGSLDLVKSNLTETENNLLTFYAYHYPRTMAEPKIMGDERIENPSRFEASWRIVKDELDGYIELYCKHIILYELKSIGATNEDAVEFARAAHG